MATTGHEVTQEATHEASRQVAPTWIDGFLHEIDTLEFADAFAALFDEHTEMIFGTARVRGVAAIKDFFVTIDEPLHTTHELVQTWVADDAVILRGEATIAKKTEPDTVIRAPFTHILYLDRADRDSRATPRIRTLHITAGPIVTDTLI
ncbi:hypothetical protein ABH935_009688 [Catenulispora sp. GAS73]|uniref:nuclear transport factor 2 family protein n=1 Tax=Catenulispora sp. GAS73 TaxID=3156269 RepID=UPI00351429DB